MSASQTSHDRAARLHGNGSPMPRDLLEGLVEGVMQGTSDDRLEQIWTNVIDQNTVKYVNEYHYKQGPFRNFKHIRTDRVVGAVQGIVSGAVLARAIYWKDRRQALRWLQKTVSAWSCDPSVIELPEGTVWNEQIIPRPNGPKRSSS